MGLPIERDESLHEIFEEHRAELYWLAFLLTGNRELGVEAFSRAVNFEDSANPVFRGFMAAWARKLVIAEALAQIGPELGESRLRSEARDASQPDRLPSRDRMSADRVTRPEFEHAVLALDVFERCAMLLTVFERLSIPEVALLLNAGEELVKKAQVQGLIELTRNIAAGRGWDPIRATRETQVIEFRTALMWI
jgi:DNA-directed RNA polymerase specialized sigma24 family protein